MVGKQPPQVEVCDMEYTYLNIWNYIKLPWMHFSIHGVLGPAGPRWVGIRTLSMRTDAVLQNVAWTLACIGASKVIDFHINYFHIYSPSSACT